MSVDLLSQYGLEPKRPEVIDSSMLKDFVDCPSLFYLRHVLGLVRARRSGADAAKFDWGICWHGLMENYWNLRMKDENTATVLALRWLNENFPSGIRADTDRHKRSKERMVKMFFEYVEEQVPEIEATYETLRTEQFFDVFNEELGIRWAGRVDKVRRLRRNGSIVIWDYKTTSAMGDSYFSMHENGFQFPGYVWAANQMQTEVVNEIVADVLYTLTASHKFFRRTFRYDQHKLREWTDNVKIILDQMHFMLDKHLYDPRAWYQNRNHCTKWGLCTFADVHFIAPIGDTRLRILENDYKIERWDPLAHAEELV